MRVTEKCRTITVVIQEEEEEEEEEEGWRGGKLLLHSR
jgi:hypothetical protein